MTDYLRIQNATKLGYLDGYPGDGVVLNLLGRARGRVQSARSPTLRTVEGGGTGVVTMTDDNNLTIRKLTPRECLRLQGYNDDEIDRLANAVDDKGRPLFPKTRLYFFAGNSVVVDVFAALLGEIVADMATPSTENRNSLDYWMGVSQ